MQTRWLGNTGQAVSEIGFGAWGIGKSWWGASDSTDDRESLRALQRALDLGITFFDTAYAYGDGHSEELIATALSGAHPPLCVATKCPPKNQEWPANPRTLSREAFPEDWILACTERSLRNLHAECLDLQQFHVWTDAWLLQDEWKSAVQKLKRQGKIKHFGVSINDSDPESALKLVASGFVDTVQVIFNIFEQEPAKSLFPLCQQMKVGIIARVPFDEGSLTGLLTPQTVFEPEDFRKHYFARDRLKDVCSRVEKLKACLGPHTPTLPLLALKFILSHPAVSVVIPGMRKARHVEENVQASDGKPLPSTILQTLHAHAWHRNFYR